MWLVLVLAVWLALLVGFVIGAAWSGVMRDRRDIDEVAAQRRNRRS